MHRTQHSETNDCPPIFSAGGGHTRENRGFLRDLHETVHVQPRKNRLVTPPRQSGTRYYESGTMKYVVPRVPKDVL